MSMNNLVCASSTLPSSPTRSFSSDSSSDFEFTVVLSPSLCPADDLFYKGQILPLQLSSRISMVHNLLLSSPCSSSSDTSRDSTGSSNDSLPSCCDSVTAAAQSDPDDMIGNRGGAKHNWQGKGWVKNGYFVLSKFSYVFRRKDIKQEKLSSQSTKRMSAAAKEVIGKCLKKVKPIYEKVSSQKYTASGEEETMMEFSAFDAENTGKTGTRGRGSFPSSTQSSPSHSVILPGGRPGFSIGSSSDVSSKEESHDAIQCAIAHCKKSMSRNEVDTVGLVRD